MEFLFLTQCVTQVLVQRLASCLIFESFLGPTSVFHVILEYQLGREETGSSWKFYHYENIWFYIPQR